MVCDMRRTTLIMLLTVACPLSSGWLLSKMEPRWSILKGYKGGIDGKYMRKASCVSSTMPVSSHCDSSVQMLFNSLFIPPPPPHTHTHTSFPLYFFSRSSHPYVMISSTCHKCQALNFVTLHHTHTHTFSLTSSDVRPRSFRLCMGVKQ